MLIKSMFIKTIYGELINLNHVVRFGSAREELGTPDSPPGGELLRIAYLSTGHEAVVRARDVERAVKVLESAAAGGAFERNGDPGERMPTISDLEFDPRASLL
jgi:hypothetical protein